MLHRLGYIVLAVILIGSAVWGFGNGFSRLSDVRQLDRLPITPIAALTSGSYAIEGRVIETGNTIVTPYSKKSVVYYRYKLTETYTDSDGDRSIRVLDEGESATSFNFADASGEIRIEPGFNISEIAINAPQTLNHSAGKLTYTEYTIFAGDHLQITGGYDSALATFKLSGFDSKLPKIVTTQTLTQEGGKSLIWVGLVISASVGSLAVGIALLLSGFVVHRFWVFVVVMTISLMGTLVIVGVKFMHNDWQRVASHYSVRADAVLNSPTNIAAQEDLYLYYLLLQKSALDWPDSTLFNAFAQSHFKLPELSDSSLQQLDAKVKAHEVSRFDTPWLIYLLCVLASIACINLVWHALVAIRFKRLVEFVPTSKSTGLTYGLAELFGAVKLDDAKPKMFSPHTQEACVGYRYIVEELRGTGKKKRWIEVESKQDSECFMLVDDHGEISVNPDQATIEYPKKSVHRERSRRYTEYWLPPMTQIYCLGFAGLNEQNSSTLAMKSSDELNMLITEQNEQKVISSKGMKGFLLTGLALAFGLIAGTVWLAGTASFAPLDLLTVSLIVPVILLIITLVMHYNSLVFLRQRVNKAAADIDTLLQKRHDLWPRLQETVKGYLAHEQSLLEDIASARSKALSLQDSTDAAAHQLANEEKIVNRLIALAEQYPDLKANNVVVQFTEQMQRNEDELALVRQGYNDSVTLYNTQIEKLPDVILAKIFGFRSASLFHKLEPID